MIGRKIILIIEMWGRLSTRMIVSELDPLELSKLVGNDDLDTSHIDRKVFQAGRIIILCVEQVIPDEIVGDMSWSARITHRDLCAGGKAESM